MTVLTDEELFEARSMRYVDAARVVFLPTARKYVVFSMTRGDCIGVIHEDQMPGNMIVLLEEAIRKSSEFWSASREQELSQKDPGVASVSASAADLGL